MKDKTFCNLLVVSIGLVLVASVVAVGASTMDKASNGSDYNVSRSPAVIYVPDVYPTIQAAVNAASAGDTIIVSDGYYIENVDVNKRLTIRSENGPGSTIIRTEDSAPHTDDHVFDVTVDYVNISGFGVEGSYDNAGMHLYYADYCNISNNICSNNAFGISIDYSNNSSIINNDCTNNGAGIALFESSNNSISNNACSSNNRYFGIGLLCSNNNSISKNMCYSSKQRVNGIYLGHSRNNIISNNSCSSNSVGIFLKDSNNNRIFNNTQTDINLESANNNCIFNNTRTNITLERANNNCISNNTRAYIYLDSANNNRIFNNICSSNSYGILACYSNNNSITNNNCSNNDHSGICLIVSDDNGIFNNTCSNNGVFGIILKSSNNNRISDNTCSNNGFFGIYSWYSNNNKLKGNVMVGNGIFIEGETISDYTNEIDTSNLVNGKPVYYWKDVNGGRVPDGAGQVILVNSKNVIVENQNINNASIGIAVVFSSYITIKKDDCSNNRRGIYLDDSHNNSISNNTCSNNDYNGIYLSSSKNNRITNNICSNNRYGIQLWDSNNSIYLNNFINNTDNVYYYESTNLWRSNEKIAYTYNETMYTNYLGNYWDDYTGTDADGDGIGDTPYPINSDKDNYPLMEKFEHYIQPDIT